MKTPALDAWRRELAAGARTKYTFDALWRGACEDLNSLEAPTPGLAASYLREARRIIAEAVKRQRAA